MIGKVIAGIGLGLALAGCGHGDMTEGKTSPVDQLAGHEFVLQELDGQAWAQQEGGPVMLRFTREGDNQALRVSGKLCNNFNGAAQLENDTLTVKGMAMTRMLCANDALNGLDNTVSQMLEKGAHLTLEHSTLTLTGDSHTLIYRQQD